MSILFFTFVKLAITFCPAIALVCAAKQEKTIATILFFVATVCNWPLVYALSPRGPSVHSWAQLHNVISENITLFGIGLTCFLLGLLVLSYVPRTDADTEFDRFLTEHKAKNDAKKKEDVNNQPPTTWNQTNTTTTNRPNG